LLGLLLGGIDIDDAENAVAGGLGLWRNDSQLLADQRIQQRALARVRASEDADKSGVEGHGNRVLGFESPGLRSQVSAKPVSGETGVLARPVGAEGPERCLFLSVHSKGIIPLPLPPAS